MTTFSIEGRLTVDTNIFHNPYNFSEHDLFALGLRINKKRQFLFVSKVLGKHLHVKPFIPIYTGHLLANRFLEHYGIYQDHTEALVQSIKTETPLVDIESVRTKAPEQIAIIGFAETATALGHAFFDAFDDNATYIHTTRERVHGVAPTITFEEEHSHATSHRLYAPPNMFEQATRIVLVDDEMSTGQTNLNIIDELHAQYPHIQQYTVVSILDWRSAAEREVYKTFAAARGITIQVVTLMSGTMAVEGSFCDEETPLQLLAHTVSKCDGEACSLTPIVYKSTSEDGTLCASPYVEQTGRFGLTATQNKMLRDDLSTLALPKVNGKTLVIGTGECMFIPMQIAMLLDGDVWTQSTTRSPIFVDERSVIYEKYAFSSPENAGVANFLYSVSKGDFDEVVLVVERLADEEGLEALISQLNLPVTVIQLTEGVSYYDGQNVYANEL